MQRERLSNVEIECHSEEGESEATDGGPMNREQGTFLDDKRGNEARDGQGLKQAACAAVLHVRSCLLVAAKHVAKREKMKWTRQTCKAAACGQACGWLGDPSTSRTSPLQGMTPSRAPPRFR